MNIRSKDRARPFTDSGATPQQNPLNTSSQKRLSLLFGLLFLTSLNGFAGEPVLDFIANSSRLHTASESLRVRNVSPSSDILFFGDSWVRKDSVSGLIHTMVKKKSNSSGNARLNQVDIVEKAIWSAVDLSTGQYVFDSITSYGGTLLEIDQNQVFQVNNRLSFNLGRLDLLIVRPRQFAWAARIVDGAPTDISSSQDGQILFAYESIETVWSQAIGTGAFTGPERGDMIFGINPDDMTYFAFQYGVSN